MVTKRQNTVAKWAAQFKDGRESLEDDPRSERPKTMNTAENIERMPLLKKTLMQYII